MRIIVKCNNCEKELEVPTTCLVPGSYDVMLSVVPCKSQGCNECSECEDMKLLKVYREADKQLQSKLKETLNDKGVSN